MVPKDISGDFYIRFTAEDIFGNKGSTQEIKLSITRPQEQPTENQKKKK
jgi:hypothetical protein